MILARESLTLVEAQNLVLKKQRLTPSARGRSREDVVNVIKGLCGVQYDPLPVIAQAHYVTLWNRVDGFREDWLDSLLYEDRRLIEFMLMRQTLNIVAKEELPYYFQGTRSVARNGWIQGEIDKKEGNASKEILQRIGQVGEVSPKDFHFAAFRPLFYSGNIFVARRNKGVFRMPYYRLFSDYFPSINLQSVDEAAARKYVVLKALSAYGISPSRHIAYWIGYRVGETEHILQELEQDGIVTKVKIESLGGLYWASVEDLNKLEADINDDFVALLTLIDNLTRDRKWLQKLFNYTFEVEYFRKKGMKWHVNILQGNEFLGFINPKIDRPKRVFLIKDMVLKRDVEYEELERVMGKIKEFAQFQNAEEIQVLKTGHPEIKKVLQRFGFFEKERGKLALSLN
jgi:uncharacterized protein YcaQ